MRLVWLGRPGAPRFTHNDYVRPRLIFTWNSRQAIVDMRAYKCLRSLCVCMRSLKDDYLPQTSALEADFAIKLLQNSVPCVRLSQAPPHDATRRWRAPGRLAHVQSPSVGSARTRRIGEH